MEWDSWPNEGYPCAECGRIGTCMASCRLRQNDPLPRVSCPECGIELPAHRAFSPACSQLAICRLCGEPKSKHTKKPADWRDVPGCTGFYVSEDRP